MGTQLLYATRRGIQTHIHYTLNVLPSKQKEEKKGNVQIDHAFLRHDDRSMGHLPFFSLDATFNDGNGMGEMAFPIPWHHNTLRPHDDAVKGPKRSTCVGFAKTRMERTTLLRNALRRNPRGAFEAFACAHQYSP